VLSVYQMKGHVSLLALSVLCPALGIGEANAWAQTPAPTADPSVPVGAPPLPAPPAAAHADGPAPPTPVDSPPPTPVHTSPASVPVGSPSAPPAPVVAPAPAVASTPPRVGLGEARFRDAHVDRLFFAPTAETHPQGSFYATSYYIVVAQLGYAVTDDTQISVTGMPPVGDEHVLPLDISVKTRLLRSPHVRLAAIGSASGLLGVEEFSGFLGRVGGVATFCVDARECRLGFSMSSNVALAGPASVLFSGVGLNFRAGRIVSIIAEVATALPLAEPVGEANGVVGGAGARLSGRAWGFDLGLMTAGKAHDESSGIFPFLAATYRYVP